MATAEFSLWDRQRLIEAQREINQQLVAIFGCEEPVAAHVGEKLTTAACADTDGQVSTSRPSSTREPAIRSSRTIRSLRLVELNRAVLEESDRGGGGAPRGAPRHASRADSVERRRRCGRGRLPRGCSGSSRCWPSRAARSRPIRSRPSGGSPSRPRKASKDLVRQVAEVVRAAQSLSRGGAARARWLLVGAVIGAACCTVAFVAGELVTASNVFQRAHGR